MLGLVLLALLLQGPRDLQVNDDRVAKPVPIVPKGTAFPVALVNRLSTKNIQVGATIYAKTVFPVTAGNEVVIPEGSSIIGKVLDAKRPGRIKGKPSLMISFQTLIFSSGVTVPILASLGGSDTGIRKGEASIEGESGKAEDVEKVAVGGARGGVIGGIFGGLRGLGLGAGAGAAAGLAEVLISRGDDLTLERGTTIEIILDEDLKL